MFRFHWLEEAQHAVLDELEWKREDRKLDAVQRDRAVNDFIALVAAVDGILQQQAKVDCDYFVKHCGRSLPDSEVQRFHNAFLSSYRWQYIFSGVQVQRFMETLTSLITEDQLYRIENALLSLVIPPAGLEGDL